ncbi:MAG: helix-turn-helix domain-containing protein [Acidobacteria bacterium]|nr:helix-turn-helix domain-containing protein [Acidobacteriota bacterium]
MGTEAVMPDNLLTITRAATLLNVSREFIVTLLDERTIPSVGVGARRRIEEPVLYAFRELRNTARHGLPKGMGC